MVDCGRSYVFIARGVVRLGVFLFLHFPASSKREPPRLRATDPASGCSWPAAMAATCCAVFSSPLEE